MKLIAETARAHFQSIGGRRPETWMETHPDSQSVALEYMGVDGDLRGAIYDSTTGEAIWQPKDARGLCWSHDGHRVFVLRSERALEEPKIAAHSWPERALILETDLLSPSGYGLAGMAVDLTGRQVAVAWLEQGECGVAVLDLEAPLHRAGEASWSYNGSNHIVRPTFDPSGQFVVTPIGASGAWWQRAPGQSAHGSVLAGEIFIFDLQTRSSRRIRVDTSLPDTWEPADPKNILTEFLSPVEFLDARTFRLLLPTGEWRAYGLDGTDRGNPTPGVHTSPAQFYTWAPNP